jgi:hypothetical protein
MVARGGFVRAAKEAMGRHPDDVSLQVKVVAFLEEVEAFSLLFSSHITHLISLFSFTYPLLFLIITFFLSISL